jgi:hypothetical protein
LSFQRIGMCAAVLFLVVAAGAQTVFSRPLAGVSVKGGFLLAQDSATAGPARDLADDPPAAGVAEAAADSAAADVPAADSAASRPVKTKNPTGALLRSLALPGWGQFYNEQYIKSALAVAIEGLLVAGAVVEHQRAEDGYDIYQDASQPDEVREAAWRRYSRRIDKRNAYLWYYLGFKFLSIIDAYVDAHLYRFDEGPFAVQVRPGGGAAGQMTIVVRYHL